MRVPPDQDGLFRSKHFPASGSIRKPCSRTMASSSSLSSSAGLATPDHTAFKDRLAASFSRTVVTFAIHPPNGPTTAGTPGMPSIRWISVTVWPIPSIRWTFDPVRPCAIRLVRRARTSQRASTSLNP